MQNHRHIIVVRCKLIKVHGLMLILRPESIHFPDVLLCTVSTALRLGRRRQHIAFALHVERKHLGRPDVQILYETPAFVAEHKHLEQHKLLVVAGHSRLDYKYGRVVAGMAPMEVLHPVDGLVEDLRKVRMAPFEDANGGCCAQFVGQPVADQCVHMAGLAEQDAALVISDLGDFLHGLDGVIEHRLVEGVHIVASRHGNQQQREPVVGEKLAEIAGNSKSRII